MGHVAVVLGRSSAVFTAAGRSKELPHRHSTGWVETAGSSCLGKCRAVSRGLLADTCSVVTTSPDAGAAERPSRGVGNSCDRSFLRASERLWFDACGLADSCRCSLS